MMKIIGYTISKIFLFFMILFIAILMPSIADAKECPTKYNPNYYPFEGVPTFELNGFIKIQYNKNKDFSLTVKAEDIMDGKLLKNQSNGQFSFKIKPNAQVTMRYKNITHDFFMSKDERPFYIDTKKIKIIYLISSPISQNVPVNEQLSPDPDCELRCNKSVYVVDCNCCGGGYVGECYGWVSCGAGWQDSKCMKDDDGKIFCQNNCN